MKLTFWVNEKPIELDTEPDRRLLDLLREDLGLTGTKEGCGEGECGACTVILDGEAAHACMVLAIQLEGCHVTTIEGLEENGELSALQKIFAEESAIQCGFCTPGMILSAKALLMHRPHPTDEEIRRALAGNLCRCSGYQQILRAVRRAAEEGRH
ncbi:(2Fe-2S)-binding protein [Cuneatibacter sp. NSJ-177]|uniref:(2Fe-2S)-binding protein n=1 Tax=Cuneatibacter sp. NSJ-177 TaxID=2931401 RepID=UPI001FD61C98|nr:(2Fe-2S)-binding protein [Cuneatibacter sp. NSJ-177]MCJ7834740.1 (2Fe-2S)-binding protein [Cuneatibacter sp. NSJ-177]